MPIVGHVDGVGDELGHRVGHALEHDGEHARLDERLGVVDEQLGAARLLALHLEAAHGVHRLRGQADVAHHRDLGVDDGLDHRHPLAAALELHARRRRP